MLTQYVSDISHWEEWQQAYRFGMFLIFPPDPILSQVNALRATYDPRSQAACDAHISLTIPVPQPISIAHWSELESLVRGILPFPIQYGPLRHYLPYPGVCLAIEPQDVLDGLRRRLETASIFADAPAQPHPFSAHMTIADFISVEQTKALMHELADVAPRGSFTCTGVSYAVPDAKFHFYRTKAIEYVFGIIVNRECMKDACRVCGSVL